MRTSAMLVTQPRSKPHTIIYKSQSSPFQPHANSVLITILTLCLLPSPSLIQILICHVCVCVCVNSTSFICGLFYIAVSVSSYTLSMAWQFVTYGHLSSRSEGKPQTPLPVKGVQSEIWPGHLTLLPHQHAWSLKKSTQHNKKKLKW